MAQTILIVDDDPSIVNLLSEVLQAEGYDVLEAYDGATALQVGEKSRPSLIVMDVQMPGMTGLEALTRFRQSPSTKTTPVVLLTGESTSSADPVADRLDRITRLEKPVDLERFNQVVRGVLAQPVR